MRSRLRHAWVAKEALLKACGRSLGTALGKALGTALATPIGADQHSGAELPFTCDAGDARITLFAPAAGFGCAIAR